MSGIELPVNKGNRGRSCWTVGHSSPSYTAKASNVKLPPPWQKMLRLPPPTVFAAFHVAPDGVVSEASGVLLSISKGLGERHEVAV